MDEEDYSTAVKHYREVIKLNRKLESVHYDLVAALLADENIDAARNALTQAESQFEANFMQAYFGAMIHLEEKAYLKAHETLLTAEARAKRVSPSDSRTFFISNSAPQPSAPRNIRMPKNISANPSN